MRYRTTSFLDSLRIARIIPDAQLVASQCLPESIATIDQTDLTEYLRHSNTPHAYREQLIALQSKAANQ